jgi:predicted N-acyltransferase
LLAEHGFLQRTDQQFHWHNQGFASFDDFLATMNSRHRKSIKRERRDALAAGVTIHCLTGKDITEEAWDAFFDFYMETGSRKWGRPYLTREFFTLIGESMSQDVLLVMARRDHRWIAGAINFIGSDTLFGRNWGAIEHHPFACATSRPARKASTRSRAATCRRPRTPRISSPTAACAAPSPII